MSTESRGHSNAPSADKRRWRTPPTLFRALQAEMGKPFDLDASASPGAEVCPIYIAPPGFDASPAGRMPAGVDCLTTDWRRLLPDGGDVWFNPPWGVRLVGVPGTLAYVERAIEMCSPKLRVWMLVPNAPDTRWWRMAFSRAAEVRHLPRVSFLDPDTGEALTAPPGSGVTLFILGPSREDPRQPRCNLATVRGLCALPGSEVSDG